MKRRTVLALTAALALPAASSAIAAPASDNNWHISFAPLLWGVSMNGVASVGPATAPVNIEFQDDKMENLEAVLSWHFELRNNDFSLFLEHQYIDLVPTTALPSGEQVNVGLKNVMVELAAAYTVLKSARTGWQVIGGLRLTKQLLSINDIPSPPSTVSSFNTDQRWTDAFIGGRVFAGITDNWQFIVRADIGAGGSDRMWNLVGMFDYRFTSWGSSLFGYRILDYDYDNGESGQNSYAFNGKFQGPLVGLNFRW